MPKIIIVIEDQPEIRDLICWTLDYGDFELHQANDGESGLRLIKALKPDLVLLDVMMPGRLDGYQVCEHVRTDPEIAATVIVMLTARAQQADQETGARAGSNVYLIKPFSPLQLIDTVINLLELRSGSGH